MLLIKAYHVVNKVDFQINGFKKAIGFDQWLGDGYYFWYDIEMARWWKNQRPNDIILECEIRIKEETFLDTVFNETDYLNFVQKVDQFAEFCQKIHGTKPSIEIFNKFITQYLEKGWQDFQLMRFQDAVKNESFLKVTGFHYKKRIQYRLLNRDNIINHKEY